MAEATMRRSDRVCMTLLLEVDGVDSSGHSFKTAGRTMLISRHGAVIVLDQVVETNAEMTIRRRAPGETYRQGLVKVIGLFGQEHDGKIYGVSLIHPEQDIWGVEFPELSESDETVARMLLECSFCRSREVAHLGEIELKGFEINRGTARNCKTCGMPTIWVQAVHEMAMGRADRFQTDVDPAPTPRNYAIPSAPPVPAVKKPSGRVKTRLSACVRKQGLNEEPAVCEEISKSSVAIRCRQRFEYDTRLDISVPYTPGTANIFMPGKVTHVEEVRAGLYRHEIEYIKAGEATR